MIKSKSKLAFFRQPDGSRPVVLTRVYGELTAVILDDGDLGENAVIRLYDSLADQFLEPYCEGIVDPALTAQYDEIQFHLTENDLPILKPLASVRAARHMREQGCLPEPAIALALQMGVDLTAQQTARLSLPRS